MFYFTRELEHQKQLLRDVRFKSDRDLEYYKNKVQSLESEFERVQKDHQLYRENFENLENSISSAKESASCVELQSLKERLDRYMILIFISRSIHTLITI